MFLTTLRLLIAPRCFKPKKNRGPKPTETVEVEAQEPVPKVRPSPRRRWRGR
jgi:hypothetical protein